MFGDEIGVLGEQNTIFSYYAQMGSECIFLYSMANDSITEIARYEKESPDEYMDLTFLPAFSLDDLSGLNWTRNPSGDDNQSLIKSFLDM